MYNLGLGKEWIITPAILTVVGTFFGAPLASALRLKSRAQKLFPPLHVQANYTVVELFWCDFNHMLDNVNIKDAADYD